VMWQDGIRKNYNWQYLVIRIMPYTALLCNGPDSLSGGRVSATFQPPTQYTACCSEPTARSNSTRDAFIN
jgi:hypothetical protein